VRHEAHRIRTALALAACALLALAAAPAPAGARDLVGQGNRAFAKGDYRQALDAYEKASVDEPESPIILFDRGVAFYRLEDYAKAREALEQAAIKSRDLAFEAKCLYNLGNCAFQEGRRQQDSDLRKALAAFQESARRYKEALQRDPGLQDAAHNIEVARLTVKRLLDEIRKQEEKRQEQQKKQQDFQNRLQDLIQRQQKALDRNQELQKQRATANANDLRRKVQGLADEQEKLHKDTEDLAKQAPQPDPQTPPPQKEPLDKAAAEQSRAVEALGRNDLGQARPPQEKALEALKEAAPSAADQKQSEGGDQPKSDDKGPQQPAQAQQQPASQSDYRKQEARGESARDILNEEKDHRDQRSRAQRAYTPVDKDW
jgi:hypothetical protein